jgi:hypothetical protein
MAQSARFIAIDRIFYCSGNPKNEGIAEIAAWNGKIGQALHLPNGIVYHHVRESMWL